MDNETAKWLFDAQKGVEHIRAFVKGKTFEEYAGNVLLRSAVERQFEIVGEAIKRVRDKEPELLDKIEGWRGAISFRNILAHGYDQIEDEIVWNVIETDLPHLATSLKVLLPEL